MLKTFKRYISNKMLVIQGVCAVCKGGLDIISAGMACSVCAKCYHGICMKPVKTYEEIEEHVINTTNWLCETCSRANSNIQLEPRTEEDKENVKTKAAVLKELREIIIMIDELITAIMHRCDELIRNARMVMKYNQELRQRINLHKTEMGTPLTLKSWVKKRRILRIGTIVPCVYLPYSNQDIISMKKKFMSFKKDWNISGPMTRRTSFLFRIFRQFRQRKKKKHSLGNKAPSIRRWLMFVFYKLYDQHRRWHLQAMLFFGLVLHTFIGALVLYLIEGTHEQIYHEQVQLQRSFISNELIMVENYVSTVGFNNSDNLLQNVSTSLLSNYFDFLERSIEAYYHHALFQTNEGNWDFLGSLFFCATTSMTVGFGDVVPVTSQGKVFTMFFALTGVPLFLTFASSLGKSLNQLIHVSSVKLHVRRKSMLVGYNSEMEDDFTGFPLWMFFLMYWAYVIVGSLLFMIGESWNFLEAYYFVVLTLATIGIGDMIPTNRKFVMGSLLFLIGGHVMTATAIHMIMWKLKKKFEVINDKLATKASQMFE